MPHSIDILAKRSELEPKTDLVAEEAPLTIDFPAEARQQIVVLRTPGDDHALVRGFLAGEFGVEGSIGATIELIDSKAVVRGVPFDIGSPIASATSCGLCGRAPDEIGTLPKVSVSSATWSEKEILAMPEKMRSMQSQFEETGGIHAAALFDAGAKLIAVAEDVGRHNAIDKVIGRAISLGANLGDLALCSSGRISYEVVRKAANLGIPAIVAVSAPTSLAVKTALEHRITLCGFVRPPRYNIYSWPHRVLEAPDFLLPDPACHTLPQ